MKARAIAGKLATIRFEGPIDIHKYNYFINLMGKLDKQKLAAVAVIINSYGGSLASARGISDAVKSLRDRHKIPVYCFAEDFCLNSANLILTSGTKSYANKLSMIGDLGFVSQAIDDEKIFEKHGFGRTLISNSPIKVRSGPLSQYSIDDQKFRQNLVNKGAKELIDGILKNRGINVKLCNNSNEEFEKKLMAENIIDPYDAVKIGLLDAVYNLKELQNQHYPHNKVIQYGEADFGNPYMNLIKGLVRKIDPRRYQ